MREYTEFLVIRLPVRNADGLLPSVGELGDDSPAPAREHPLVPVCELSALAPAERIVELRQRVISGVYGRRDVVEQVARGMVLARRESHSI